MIKRYWNCFIGLLKFIGHTLLNPEPIFDILKKPEYYFQIFMLVVGFFLGFYAGHYKDSKGERERDTAILTAYKMELSNNVERIQFNMGLLRNSLISSNAHSVDPLFQYRNTGLDLIKQRIPNQIVKKPTTLTTINLLCILTDNANERLRLRNSVRLATVAVTGNERTILDYDQRIIDGHNYLLYHITNALITLDKL